MGVLDIAGSQQNVNIFGAYQQGKAMRIAEQNEARKMQMEEERLDLQERQVANQEAKAQAEFLRQQQADDQASAERALEQANKFITDDALRITNADLAKKATTVEGTQAFLENIQVNAPDHYKRNIEGKWDLNDDGILDESLRESVIGSSNAIDAAAASGDNERYREVLHAFQVQADPLSTPEEKKAAKLITDKAAKDAAPESGKRGLKDIFGFPLTEDMKHLIARGVEPGSEEWNEALKPSQSEAERRAAVLIEQGISEDMANLVANKLATIDVSPHTGMATITNLKDMSVVEVPVTPNIPKEGAPVDGVGLYGLADKATGPISGWESFKASKLAWLGVEYDEATVFVRQKFATATRGYIAAMALNPRFPIGEQQMIILESALSPEFFQDPGPMKVKLRALDESLRARAEELEGFANDTSLGQKDRREAAISASHTRKFLRELNVPPELRGVMSTTSDHSYDDPDKERRYQEWLKTQ